jgi:uncharacterized membrane protein
VPWLKLGVELLVRASSRLALSRPCCIARGLARRETISFTAVRLTLRATFALALEFQLGAIFFHLPSRRTRKKFSTSELCHYSTGLNYFLSHDNARRKRNQ